MLCTVHQAVTVIANQQPIAEARYFTGASIWKVKAVQPHPGGSCAVGCMGRIGRGGCTMTWNIAWSWQADARIATMAAVEGGLLVSSGLNLVLLEANGEVRWKVDVPFKVHAAEVEKGTIGLLAAHGFYLMNTSNGTMLNEGRSAPGGFSDLTARPGGGWALAGRKGQIHLFSEQGRGIRRVDSGPVRRLLGWLDREHLLWQDPEGYLWCGRLTGDDKKRKIENRSWSWCSSLKDGRLLMQSGDGGVWEGVPHPFGWDVLERLESIPLSYGRCSNGRRLVGAWYRRPSSFDERSPTTNLKITLNSAHESW